MSIQDLTASLDLKQNLNIYATCKQSDNLNLILSIYDNSVQADLTNYTIRLKAMKSDNIPLIQENVGITKLNNIVTIIANEQLTTTSGKTLIELEFINTSTGLKKATFNLVLQVVPSTIEVNATISMATYTLLQELENKLDQASDFLENIDEAIVANNNLTATIATATTKNTNLETNIATANTSITSGTALNNSLNENIIEGTTLDGELDAANTLATSNIAAMESFGDVTVLSQDVTALKSEIITARGSSINLDARLDGIDTSLSKSIACFGDSFTRSVSDVNGPASDVRDQFETYLWFNLVCDTLKPFYKKNNGVGGSRLYNLSFTLHSTLRNDVHYKKYLLNIGYNDLTDYLNVANANEDIANKIQTACIFLKTRNKKTQYTTNTWTWMEGVDELSYELGATSGKLGLWLTTTHAPIEFTFTGRYLVIFTVDNTSAGTYLVKSDGTTIFNADIKRNKRLANAPYCLKVDCGTVGTHTIQFSSPDGSCYIAGYGEYDASIEVYVNELTKRIDTTYDTATTAINTFIATRISELNDSNIKVVSMANYTPSAYVGTDSLHPNILGHMKIAQNVLNTIIS